MDPQGGELELLRPADHRSNEGPLLQLAGALDVTGLVSPPLRPHTKRKTAVIPILVSSVRRAKDQLCQPAADPGVPPSHLDCRT